VRDTNNRSTNDTERETKTETARATTKISDKAVNQSLTVPGKQLKNKKNSNLINLETEEESGDIDTKGHRHKGTWKGQEQRKDTESKH